MILSPSPVLRAFAKEAFRGLTLCCSIVSLCATLSVWASSPAALSADIQPQALPLALAEFAHQTDLQLIYVTELARGRVTGGARAGMPVSDALSQLLKGTGLQFQFLNSRTIRVFAAPASKKSASSESRAVALEEPAALEQIIVTASQREEALESVPISIAVWTQDRMEVAGIKDMQSLAALTPGVEINSYTDLGPGVETNIAIRGINAKDGSTTGVYLDDTPIPTDRNSVFGRAFPETFDLARVEVMRGAQGTLAGEGTEGGVVRFITKRPSLMDFDGFARAEYAMTRDGAPSYEAGAAAGGPLIKDMLGIRLAASTQRPGGFVDRVSPFTGATVDANANRARLDAVRAAITFAPTASIRVTPAFYFRSSDLHDTPAFYTYLSDPGQGLLRNGKLLQQWATDRFYVASLTLEASLDIADVVATSAYIDRYAQMAADSTNNRYWFWPNPMGPEYPVSYTNAKPGFSLLGQFVVSEQLRINSPHPAARLTWIAGASYLHGHDNEHQEIVNEAVADDGDAFGDAPAVRMTEETSLFGQFTFRATAKIAATAGLRIEEARYQSRGGFGIGGGGLSFFDESSASTQTAPRFNLSFQPNQHDLYYLTVAKGYRMGGPNAQQGSACPVQTPLTYGSDAVWNVEVGAKDAFLEGVLRLDSSLYVARWNSLQTPIAFPECGYSYTTNAGAAISRGIDLGIEGLIGPRLKAYLTVAYSDAHYTQTVLSNGAVVVGRGDVIGSLPLVPAPWTGTAAADYQLYEGRDFTVDFHAQDVVHTRNTGPFTTDRQNALIYVPTRTPNPATNEFDLRMAASWRDLEVAAFMSNALNAQPLLDRRNSGPAYTLFYATTFRPRTTGLTLLWHF